MRSKKQMRQKRLAAKTIMHWVGEAWNDLEAPCYAHIPPVDREEVKYYIHRYGRLIGLLLRCRYRPHN